MTQIASSSTGLVEPQADEVRSRASSEWISRHIVPIFTGRPRSALARYFAGSLLVAVFFLLAVALQGKGRPECFFVLLPAIFIASTFCDCGIYAALVSAFALYWLVLPPHDLVVPMQFVPALIIFLISAVGLALLSQALMSALDRASAADRTKDLLLHELNHRTKNNFAMAVSILSIEQRLTHSPEVRASLSKVAERVVAIANAHDYFRPSTNWSPHDDVAVEMRAYLTNLGAHLNGALKEVRPVAIDVEVDEQYLPSRLAIAMALIVNELVTNALKHAFPDGRSGKVRIVLSRREPFELIVEDNGVGPPKITEGTGSRLTQLLARQLHASVNWEDAHPGCRVRVSGSSIASGH